ncbi:HAD-IA family hydrolase [Haloechinothrix salitolerans]|uniref:HAD family hydrolase n=1 Tax=Haloechinothrix salitolerans TaxID=926830 RepID=A0ABW2C2T2_9PSEU
MSGYDAPAILGNGGWDAVLFDMDGTLVDSEKLWDIALGEAAERLGGVLSRDTRERMLGSHTEATLRMLFDDVGVEPTPGLRADVARWLETRMGELLSGELPWLPGAREALADVRRSGVPTALVTSTVRTLTDLALVSIGRRNFDVTVCGDEVDGHNKPHPEPYLRAARKLDVDPARCLAIEDSPTGVAAASAAGCTVVVVPGELTVDPGDRRVFVESLAAVRLV